MWNRANETYHWKLCTQVLISETDESIHIFDFNFGGGQSELDGSDTSKPIW